jgi:hypothetical protein
MKPELSLRRCRLEAGFDEFSQQAAALAVLAAVAQRSRRALVYDGVDAS